MPEGRVFLGLLDLGCGLEGGRDGAGLAGAAVLLLRVVGAPAVDEERYEEEDQEGDEDLRDGAARGLLAARRALLAGDWVFRSASRHVRVGG